MCKGPEVVDISMMLSTRGRVRHMGVCVAAETEAGRPSQAKDNAVCVSGLCALKSISHFHCIIIRDLI